MFVSSPDRSSSPFESAATRQLRRGVWWLRFADRNLEHDFRRDHRGAVRQSVALYACLSVGMVIVLIVLDHVLMHRVTTIPVLLMRTACVGSLATCAYVAMRPAYLRHYHLFVQWLMPVFGLSVVANDLLDQPMGVSFFPGVIMGVFGIYLLSGLLLLPALLSGACVLVAYGLAQWWRDLPLPERVYHDVLLLFTNIVGATACYTLERLRRLNFLEAQVLSEMANRDGLTGIFNRRAFGEHLERVWDLAVREQTPVAMLLVDIDCFKLFNDRYGHQIGDDCLRKVARLLEDTTRRPLDMCARYGGEEFGIILYGVDHSYVEQTANLVRRRLGEMGIPHDASTVSTHVTVSIGAALILPQLARTTAGWVQLADEALYEAKGRGRDLCVIKGIEHYHSMATGRHRIDSAH